jgi:hypothetical protein
MRLALVAVVVAVSPGASAVQDAPANPIDGYFASRWKAESLAPASPADDHEFFRRISLDLLGRLPTPDEIRAYAGDKKADKRLRLVDRLLASEEHAEFFADLWLDILVDHDVTQQDFARADLGPFRSWLRQRFHEDTPWNEIVRALLSDRGARRETPAVNFALKHLGADPLPVKLAVMSARLFLGKDIRCAQCHDHPFEEMTQDEFWGYVEFFRPLRNRGNLVELDSVRLAEPREDFGEVQGLKPKFLDGREPESGRRLGEALADFTLSTKDRSCSRAVVDRLWKHFFARRLMPPAPRAKGHLALADLLVDDFEKNGQSLRRLMRTILLSQPYQMTSAGRAEARETYAAGPLKLLGAVQFMNVFTDLFDLHEIHKKMYEKVETSPVAGQQFKDPQVMKILFYKWGQDLLLPKGRDPEEALASGTVRMAMKFMNNQRVTSMMIAQWGMLKRILSKKSKPADRIEELFLSVVSRPPTPQERRDLVEYVTASGDDKKAYEDVFWMLLNSSEFLFNH